ncbi:hypothetical protein Aasi_0962 [Candidatus Amoebophilus asiaticus 5a2]|uniref:PNPLA domain-containing protein n=1 Tax=Amoebophilus asiaticus (strain 5a2) TaxID=452471 RepID=B3ESW8_AMOA5|nr:patatin-like phospholipase family protein [Candidatus Amoebophilus asiaticus]ACE06320.1 hypothetical protein Aasi_0962 [Candidatus Amoebophilus asiaticus 5a2]
MDYRKFKYILCWLLCISIKALAVTPQLPLSNPSSHEKFRILSIDGGGVRGVIPARILQAIEERTGKPISELFDLVIGTSTGGLVTLGLVVPDDDEQGKPKYKAAKLVEIYEQKSSEIFKYSKLRNIKTGMGLWGPKYDRKHLDDILKDFFGDAKLSQTVKPAVVISFSLDVGQPAMWSTHHVRDGKKHDCYLHDVAGVTSAAPTYFAPKVFKNLHEDHEDIVHEIDGGVWANNPGLTAIRVLSFMEEEDRPDNKDIIVVSIGTGTFTSDKEHLLQQAHKLNKAGIWGWMIKADPNLIEMMMAANSDWSDNMVSLLYPNSHRVQIEIPQNLISMDNPKNVEKLRQLAEKYIATDSFKELCNKLVQP